MIGALVIPPEAASFPLDVAAATHAYLASVPPAARVASDAYFEGGYWLQLWDFLLSSAIGVALLHTGASARVRDLATRFTRVRPLQVAAYWAMYLLVVSVASFPLEVYAGFVREHAYGLSNMTLGAWLGDQAKAFGVAVVLGSIAVPGLYAILRRARRTWWIWGTVAAVSFLAFVITIVPVFVAPIFNRYTVLEDQTVTAPVLSLARANGIPASEVWQFNASRQSRRVSANVSGLFGTSRISLNDNLLARCSLPEIENVMGHEMGHYVLHHIGKLMLQFGLVILVGFAFISATFERLRARFAGRWRVEGVDDPAGLPLLLLLLGAYMFVMTPVINTIVRTHEIEADAFGLNAARQPDGMAAVSLKLGEYRKLEPGPIEELVFFDHPSGKHRIEMAMRWKKEHPPGAPCRDGLDGGGGAAQPRP